MLFRELAMSKPELKERRVEFNFRGKPDMQTYQKIEHLHQPRMKTGFEVKIDQHAA